MPAGADDHALNQPRLRDVVQRVAGSGIEVYGIGVGLTRRSEEKFATFYPNKGGSGTRAATGHVILGDGTGLDLGVMNQLTRLLVKSNGRQGGRQ